MIKTVSPIRSTLWQRYYNPQQRRLTSVDPFGLVPYNPAVRRMLDGGVNSGVYYTSSSGGLDITLTGVQARSLDSSGNLVQLAKGDRKALQKSLRKLVPGATVWKNGQVSVPSGTSNSAASRLLNGIANTGRSLTIAVNNNGENSAMTTNEFIYWQQGLVNYTDGGAKVFGLPRNMVVMWDPSSQVTAEERVNSNQIVSATQDPTVVLAHELIHAFNYMRSDGGRYRNSAIGNPSIEHRHYFTEGGVSYYEEGTYEEFRTVGYYGVSGDVTENQIRAQLRLRSRAAYSDRKDWKSSDK